MSPAPDLRTNPARGVLLVFVLLVALTGGLFYVFGRDVERHLQDRVRDDELERSRGQAREFAGRVAQELRKSRFGDLVAAHEPAFRDFRELTDALIKQNRYITYVHLQDARGETLIYKGPDTMQKVVFRDGAVEFMERTTETIRYLTLESEAGRSERIVDLATLLVSADQGAAGALGQLRVGLSGDRLERDAAATATGATGSRFFLYLGVATLTLAGGFLGVRYHLDRVQRLESSLATQTRLAYVGTLASGLAHELRNPLNGVSLNLALVEEELGGADEAARARLETLMGRIRPELGHLEKIVNEFLAFARPPRVELAPVDVNQAVGQVADLLAPRCEAARVRLVRDFDPSLTAPRRLDRLRLRQVLENLAVNAVQAMPDGGELTLRTRGTSEGVEVAVEDTGCGFSDEAKRNLFQLFFTTKEGGVGLGLPIVQRLVADVDGTVELFSEEGRGARFLVRLPAPSEGRG